ncbi:3-deoxy-7-phosphoheptulonate synthase [Candidatus Carsonella ruddii]|uniref:3-deoxy-7-phosphoheptulonate synthase n=1 Tax=Carsonella ruddii TaxID=114186 RepID=A0A2K8K937_CARRU|nr:3-deoxy-7-phosphoheptulonate synthase [Candidatus Carsonella ruddii]ATX33541.1 3-deoxy-7-phosphoheptulonate synthase [Candidatus Carsonella ruddii]
MYKIINLKRLKKDLFNKNVLNIKIYKEIIKKNLKKLIIIIGPCSLSNIKELFFYINKIKKFFYNLKFLIRVYYEKPRTNIGWKGYVYDPYINNSFCILDGIYIIRRFLLDLINIKINIATECLNFYFLNYFIDCIIWVCIGARTMNSQIHREFCSNINNIIGIKNDSSGNIIFLNDSLKSIINKHCFLSFFENTKILFSKGNKNCQFVLRGGIVPNYNYNTVKNIKNSLIIDCSHSNSMKHAINQIYIFENIFNQFKYLKSYINGLMFESYLEYGNQSIKNYYKNISITDSCINVNILKIIIDKINNEFSK